MRHFLTFLLTIGSILPGFSQKDTTHSPPVYAQYPLPQFSIVLPDSTTIYTKDQLPKGKKVILILFSPDCDHCKHETERIKKNIDLFKKSHIVMISTMPFEKIRGFSKEFSLDQYKNIVVGRDPKYFLAGFYKIHYLPFIAVYDKKQQFIKSFEGNPKWEEFEKAVRN
ncbi:MAG: redoxin domain-containing protein [Chitinophagaceae bacterium]|nr:redoxin domain-containing protein [Chitinophagaceae bacterium]